LKFFPDTTKGPIKRINYDSKPKKHELNVEKNKRDKEEQERQEDLERKKKEKLEMEDAARYIQRKWKWF